MAPGAIKAGAGDAGGTSPGNGKAQSRKAAIAAHWKKWLIVSIVPVMLVIGIDVQGDQGSDWLSTKII
jgi:hypothetical protein